MSGAQQHLLRPQFVALDTSHLAGIIRDRASEDPTRRRRAETFQSQFDASGCVLLLCWHHLQELLSHDNEKEVATRIEFIRSLPMLAVVQTITDVRLLGSVVDLQAYEAKAAFDNPSADLVLVREQAARTIIRLASGQEIVRPMIEEWPRLKLEFQRQTKRVREIVAISRSGFTGMDGVRVLDVLNGQLRTAEDTKARLLHLENRLRNDIRDRGDKRIPNPDLTAGAFMAQIGQLAGMPADARTFGLAVLRWAGVDESEISSNTTFDDIGRIAVFRHKLNSLNEILGLPWEELKSKVTENRLPSAVIQAATHRFRPATAEWKGSDLGDSHLACLSAYAHITYVDKRTHEALRIGRAKSTALSSILGRIEKTADYGLIAEHLVQSSA